MCLTNVMKKLHFLSILVFVFISCRQKDYNTFRVAGDVRNIPASKIYLSNAYSWDQFIDSAIYNNGAFSFNVDTMKFKEPFLASLSFINSSGKIEQLPVINYIKTTTTDTFSSTGFLLQAGTTKIRGNYNSRFHRLTIEPDSENDLYFRLGSGRRLSKMPVKYLANLIEGNHESYFLLTLLYQNRHWYEPEELTELLSLFGRKMQSASDFAKISDHAAFIKTKESEIPRYTFQTLSKTRQPLFSGNKKLYMVIFWASWCGPCRLEIPMLKQLHQSFSDSLFSMVSVSIDLDEANWRKAVAEEKMKWPQLLIDEEAYEKVKSQFGANAIPLVIFYNEAKKEIKRFEGFDEQNEKAYSDFIKENLSKK